jgi:hypothetical protein
MSKYVCTCPGCHANFEVLADGEGKAVACPACSCEIKLDEAEKTEVEENGGCSGCAGCSGC